MLPAGMNDSIGGLFYLVRGLGYSCLLKSLCGLLTPCIAWNFIVKEPSWFLWLFFYSFKVGLHLEGVSLWLLSLLGTLGVRAVLGRPVLWEGQLRAVGKFSPSTLLVCLPFVCIILTFQPVRLFNNRSKLKYSSPTATMLEVVIHSYQKILTKGFIVVFFCI